MSEPRTADAAVRDALDAYAALAELGEEVEDEWTYVTDLASAWRERLESVALDRAGEALDAPIDAGIDRLIDEVALIDDPHRAIDWLSTFPQIVLLALDEPA